MISLIVATLVVIFLSGVFSGTEASLFSISLSKARQLYAEGKCSKLFLMLVENRDNYVITIVFNNNIANIAGSLVVGNIAMVVLGPGLANYIFSTMLILSIIVFAEILPKAIGARKPVQIISFMARPLEWARIALFPVVYLVTKFSDWLLKKMFGDIEEAITSEAEIRYLAQAGSDDINSEIRPSEANLIKRVFDLHDSSAEDIMTPRTCMTYLNAKDVLMDVEGTIRDCQHSRLVVVSKTVDHVAGIVFKDKLLMAMADGKQDLTIQAIGIEEVRTVSESISAEALLKIFQKEKRHLAIVMDEHDGVAGVVTLEDVLEIIVGEIVDETDTVIDMRDLIKNRKTLKRVQA